MLYVEVFDLHTSSIFHQILQLIYIIYISPCHKCINNRKMMRNFSSTLYWDMNFIMIQNTQQFAFVYYLKKTSEQVSSGLSLIKLKRQYHYIYNRWQYIYIIRTKTEIFLKCSLISVINQDIIICSRTLYFRD